MTRVEYEVTFKDGSKVVVKTYAEVEAMKNVAIFKTLYEAVEETRRPISAKRLEWLKVTGGKPSRAWA